ncbi:MAG TPA: succinate dehydrogenase assembly factor 2 [Pseudomonadales bacterium]
MSTNFGDAGNEPQLSARSRVERARWRSRRGLLELELLLAPFARDRLASLSEPLMSAYERLLAFDDLDVHAWLLGAEEGPAEVQEIVLEIRRHLGLA